ncbi:AAA-ATPase At3g50940-like [Phragmites australis]|uniref:AAA-ATPase At3g50940-like n=1 Tax=Phragmites australis TaxID=29695 RepID=UPI002D793CF3|nr:AAA-ATPase At3g50940-like [Phragmites australis]
MATNDKAVESYKKVVTTAASLAASAMLVRAVVNELVPYEVRDFLFSGLGYLRSRMSSQHTVVIEETEGWASNQLYDAVRTYLATRINTDMRRLRVSRVDEGKSMMFSMEEGEEMADAHEGTEFKWRLLCRDNTSAGNSNGNGRGRGGNGNHRLEVRSFEMTFHKKHKEKALKSYLPHILATAKKIKEQDRTLKIYMNEGESWFAIDLHHPSTFTTLAMDHKMKQSVMDDLERFVKRKEYYKRIGKAWKRGYLLYGPPGTGKSSLIAAMANYLKFDVYDLELTEVSWNSMLRRLLIGMSNRSILVIEDIDCTVDMQQREEGQDGIKSNPSEDKVTLSGLLNFVDGLWSTSGEERIIVFTTNYKERLDPALLRPGRMDMHIHMGYCCPESFRILASNYHSISNHVTYAEIEELIKEVMVTPAEVAEELMRNDDTDIVLEGLVQFLKGKKGDANDSKRENVEHLAKEDEKEMTMMEKDVSDNQNLNDAGTQ